MNETSAKHTLGPKCCTDPLTGCQTTLDCCIHNAAPELLEALIRLERYATMLGAENRHTTSAVKPALNSAAEQARAAIAKATQS